MKRTSVFEDFDRKEEISCGTYLPDLQAVLFADSYYEKESRKRVQEIVLVGAENSISKERTASAGEDPAGMHLAKGERRVLAKGSNPVLSPDGKRVLYLSIVPDMGQQLFVYELETGERKQLTTMRFGLMDPLWSPDGRYVLFTSFAADGMEDEWLQTPVNPVEEAAYAKKRAKEPVVITDFGYKFDGLGFAQPEVMQLWIIDAKGEGKAWRITEGASNFMHGNWAPDSRHVLCESNLFCDREKVLAIDVLLIDIETKEMTRVTKDQMVVSYPNPVRPVFTPDGKEILIGLLDYKEGEGAEEGYPSCTLYRVSLDGTVQEPISEKTEECFDTVQFPYNAHCGRGLEKMRISSDGRHVLFFAGYRGECRIWKVPIYGEEHRPVPLTRGKYAYNGMGVPKDGKVLVARTEMHCPEAYYLLDEESGELELLYQAGKDWLREIAFSHVEDISFETLDGESQVHGYCLPPQNREPGKKYPTIVYVHGGPHPFYTYGFDLELQCFAGAGFGVIFCNPRGSSGYGDVHRNVQRSTDGSAYMDILQFVSEASKKMDWIDENRLGLTGGSYGGYMTNYIATRAKKFKAYITQRAVVNELISYASADLQGSSKEFPTFGEFMANQIKASVICGMEKVNAPFLILHGMEDLRCPVEGAHQLFVALKDSHPEDFPVKMVLYPHLNHDQPQHPGQREHYYRTMVDWFRKYL